MHYLLSLPALLPVRLQDLSAGCEARTAYVMPAFDPLRNATLEERQNISEWAMSSGSGHGTNSTSSCQYIAWVLGIRYPTHAHIIRRGTW